MIYPLEITRDDNGTFLVTCPTLPEVTSFGEDWVDAAERGTDAVLEAIAARMDAFAEIPRPSGQGMADAPVPLAMQIKLQLYWALAEAGMSRADFARKTGWARTKVDRLFDPNHESKLGQIEEAVAALNRTIAVRLDAA